MLVVKEPCLWVSILWFLCLRVVAPSNIKFHTYSNGMLRGFFFLALHVHHVVEHQTCQKEIFGVLGICYMWFLLGNIFLGYNCQCVGPQNISLLSMCVEDANYLWPHPVLWIGAHFGTPTLNENTKKVWLIFWVRIWKSHTNRTPKGGSYLSSSGVEAIVSGYYFALPMLTSFSDPPHRHDEVYGVKDGSSFVAYMGLSLISIPLINPIVVGGKKVRLQNLSLEDDFFFVFICVWEFPKHLKT